MTDISLEWNDDFFPDSTGDLATVDGDVETRQRLERRLFTAVNGYVWHKDYGAGLPQKIGSVFSNEEIKSICAAQLQLESSVAPFPAAQLEVVPIAGGLTVISIKYFDSRLGVTVSFTITA
jgi:hypothetical protein